jgi:hypothetical protein
MRQRLIKRLEEARASPQEVQALVERMKNGTFSAEDRQRVLEVLRAEQEVLALLAAWTPPAARATQHKAKRKRQMAKMSRRRNRR